VLLILIVTAPAYSSTNGQPSTSPTEQAQVTPTPKPTPSVIGWNPETLTAIGNLWKLVVVIVGGAVFIALLIILRKQIRTFIDNIVDKSGHAGDVELKAGQLGLSLKSAAKDVAREAVEEAKDTEKAGMSQSAEVVSPAEEDPKLAGKEQQLEPKTSDEWTSDLVDALGKRNQEEVEKIYKNMQEAEINATQRKKNEALHLYAQYRFGDQSALRKLQEFTKEAEIASYAHRLLGISNEDGRNFEEALREYERAIETSLDEKRRVFDIVKAAECLFKLDKRQAAYTKIMKEVATAADPEALTELFRGLASLYGQAKDYEHRALALEKAIENAPNDTDLLFGAAYSYSEADMHNLSLLHYKTLLGFNPESSAALNNSGVTYDKLSLPNRSVASYKKAAKLNNTLASANIAYRYMNAGFSEEASIILKEASRQEHPHKNVGSAMASLAKKEETENEQETAIINAAIQQQSFLRSYAATYFTPTAEHSFAGIWLFSDGIEMIINQTDTSMVGEWLQAGKKSKIEGLITNNTAKVTLSKMQYYGDNKELFYNKDSAGYAYLSEDGRKLNIMTQKDNQHSFLTLTKKEDKEIPPGEG
jgi:tetratricopeptide (TPR) repeat protein